MTQLFPTNGEDRSWIFRAQYNDEGELTTECYSPFSGNLVINSLTDEELEALKVPSSFCEAEIHDLDSVFISKDVKFPRLFIGESGTYIRRSVKPEKATKIIISRNKKNEYKWMSNLEEVYVLINKTSKDFSSCLLRYEQPVCIEKRVLEEKGKTLQDFIKDVRNAMVNSWSYNYYIEGYIMPKNYEIDYSDKSKYTSFTALVKYFNSKMPKLTQEQKTTIISLLKSKKDENIKLAIDMMKTVDMSGILIDALLWFTLGKVYQCTNTKVLNSVNCRYIFSIFGLETLTELKKFIWYNGKCTPTLAQLYHSGLLDEEQKIKAWLFFKKSVEGFYGVDNHPVSPENQSRFEFYNMPLEIEDPNNVTKEFLQEIYDCLH